MAWDFSNLDGATIYYLQNTPVGAPPPGIKSNFVNPTTRASLQIPVCSIILAIGLLFFFNRMYVKVYLMQTWTWDDVTLSISTILGTVEFGLATQAVVTGPTGHHLWDISLWRGLQPGVQRFVYTVFVIQPWVLLFLKVSFFILYLHLFSNVQWARITSWVGLAFTIVSQAAIGIASFVVANPHEALSWQKFTPTIGITLGVVGLVIDLAIIVIPFIVVSSLRLTLAKKIGAYVIFLTGASAVVCSVLNIYYRQKIRHSKDPSWDAIYVIIAVHVEIFLGISCACVPSLAFGFRYQGSIYQKIFQMKRQDPLPRQQPMPKSKENAIELMSATSKSHIVSHPDVIIQEPRCSLQDGRTSVSIDGPVDGRLKRIVFRS